MSERAYSFELNENISAKRAVELSESDKLKDERGFCCSDKKCRIMLTCTNWKNLNGKRFYFAPSHNDDLHVIGCDEVGKKEERQQIDKEVKDITAEVRSNGIITMMISPDKNTKEAEETQNSEKISPKDIGFLYKKENGYSGVKREGRRAARIESFVELFNKENVDKDRAVICVKGTMYSLNELFVASDKTLEGDTFGIFYGESVIETCIFNSEMIEIAYLNSSLPKIYTNKDSLKKIGNGRTIKKYINTGARMITFFRGIYKRELNKLESYNDKYFKDLYFEII